MTENLPEIQKTKTDIAKQHDLSVIEQVAMQGDLSKLDSKQRVTYYHAVCESLGLNPYTKPFDYISLNGKLQLYARKDATEQLRNVKNISITSLEGRVVDDLYIVKAKATMPNGRTDESTGAVTIGNLKGDAKANAIMKAETKAKRRVTLSIAGLGWVDETEIETIPMAKKVKVDIQTGEIEAECEDLTQNINKKQIENVKNPNIPEDIPLKITFNQVTEIMHGMAKLSSESVEKYQDYMQIKWSVREYEDLPLEAYEITMKAIERALKLQVDNANN